MIDPFCDLGGYRRPSVPAVSGDWLGHIPQRRDSCHVVGKSR